jgi:hypothetical protein
LGVFLPDDHGHDREGDFLVLGPAGGLLVLEVKSSIPRWFSSTGQWEGDLEWPDAVLWDGPGHDLMMRVGLGYCQIASSHAAAT